MDLRKTLNITSGLLKKNGIAHALIGGFALAVHGISRATIDIDFLADGGRKDEIIRLMTHSGFALKHSSEEVLQFSGIGFVDIILANRPLSLEMLKNAITDNSLAVQVLKIEDLIGLKIQAYVNDRTRELQDKADIQSLIAKHSQLDWAKIKTYADLFNQWPEIETIRKKI